jgi:2-keto-4-pentenoate hydratase
MLKSPHADAMKPGASPLSRLLADARHDHATLGKPQPNLTPADADAAYAIQHEILAIGGARIGGWKIGAKSPTGPIQGAARGLCTVGAGTRNRLSLRPPLRAFGNAL